MVAYKKLSNAERLDVCKRMSKTYYENSELKKKIEETELEWQAEVKKDIPQEVIELEKKYPDSFVHRSYNIDLHELSRSLDNYKTGVSNFIWPHLNCNDVVSGFMDEFSRKHWWFSSSDLMEWLLGRNQKLYVKIRTEIIPGLKEIDKFANDLECALDSISTVNILKNEMPEAYKVYVEIYGEPQTYCSSKKKNGKNCDRIEKVRALYNSNK